MKKFILLTILLLTALTINAQISSYSKYDVEYGVVYDVEDMDSEEIKTYNSFIENGMIKGTALLYINAGRAHENLIDAPATIIDFAFSANDEDGLGDNGKVSVLIKLINTTPKTIKEITLEFEFENNSSPVYDIKTGDKYLVLKYSNLKGRTNSNKYVDIVNDVLDCRSFMRNQEASFEKPFYNKKAKAMKLHSAKVKYSDGTVSTKIAIFSNGYLGKDDIFEDGPLSPVYKILKYLDDPSKVNTQNNNINVIVPPPPKRTEEIFKSAAHMPSFPGGDAALMSYINRHIIYPKNAQDNNIQGKVIVQFVVNKDGTVGEVKVARGIDKELDAEAIRVIKSISEPDIFGERKTLFSPGRNAVGDPVNVWYTLPITFKLPITN